MAPFKVSMAETPTDTAVKRGRRRYRLAIVSAFPVHYLVPMFRELSAHPDLDVMVYFCSHAGADEPYVDSEFGGLGITWDMNLFDGYRYGLLTNVSFRPSLESFWGLTNPGIVKHLLRERYDAILLFGYTCATKCLAMATAALTRTPLMLRGETNLSLQRSAMKRFVKWLFLSPFLRSLDALLYSCTSNREYYQHYGVSDRKLFPCPCAVDNEAFESQAVALRSARPAFRAHLGISENAPVIVSVGKLTQRKRPLDLLKAFEAIHQESGAWLVFVGEGAQRDELADYVRNRKLPRVSFAGFKNRSEIPAYYAMADIFAIASDYDPSPKALNEAMNFRLSIVASSGVGTAQDLVRDGDNGFIYATGDQELLQRALWTLVSDTEGRQKMGRRSLEIVRQWNYRKDVDGVIAALDSLYAPRQHSGVPLPTHRDTTR